MSDKLLVESYETYCFLAENVTSPRFSNFFKSMMEKGDSEGKYFYGLSLLNGWGVPINSEEGWRILTLS